MGLINIFKPLITSLLAVSMINLNSINNFFLWKKNRECWESNLGQLGPEESTPTIAGCPTCVLMYGRYCHFCRYFNVCSVFRIGDFFRRLTSKRNFFREKVEKNCFGKKFFLMIILFFPAKSLEPVRDVSYIFSASRDTFFSSWYRLELSIARGQSRGPDKKHLTGL